MEVKEEAGGGGEGAAGQVPARDHDGAPAPEEGAGGGASGDDGGVEPEDAPSRLWRCCCCCVRRQHGGVDPRCLVLVYGFLATAVAIPLELLATARCTGCSQLRAAVLGLVAGCTLTMAIAITSTGVSRVVRRRWGRRAADAVADDQRSQDSRDPLRELAVMFVAHRRNTMAVVVLVCAVAAYLSIAFQPAEPISLDTILSQAYKSGTDAHLWLGMFMYTMLYAVQTPAVVALLRAAHRQAFGTFQLPSGLIIVFFLVMLYITSVVGILARGAGITVVMTAVGMAALVPVGIMLAFRWRVTRPFASAHEPKLVDPMMACLVNSIFTVVPYAASTVMAALFVSREPGTVGLPWNFVLAWYIAVACFITASEWLLVLFLGVRGIGPHMMYLYSFEDAFGAMVLLGDAELSTSFAVALAFRLVRGCLVDTGIVAADRGLILDAVRQLFGCARSTDKSNESGLPAYHLYFLRNKSEMRAVSELLGIVIVTTSVCVESAVAPMLGSSDPSSSQWMIGRLFTREFRSDSALQTFAIAYSLLLAAQLCVAALAKRVWATRLKRYHIRTLAREVDKSPRKTLGPVVNPLRLLRSQGPAESDTGFGPHVTSRPSRGLSILMKGFDAAHSSDHFWWTHRLYVAFVGIVVSLATVHTAMIALPVSTASTS